MQTTPTLSAQDDLYRRAAEEYGAALGRLARGYEADSNKRRDLQQEIHLALWRSFEGFHAQCSLRTWVYRVAHNTAISWVTRQKRGRPRMLVNLEELDAKPVPTDADRRMALEGLTRLVQRLQEVEQEILTVDDVRRQAARFERRIHWRNVREYVAGMLVIALWTLQLGRAHWWRSRRPCCRS